VYIYLTDEADSSRGSQTDENPPPVKRSKLFVNYAPKSASRQTSGSTLQQIQRYLDMEDIETDCLAFWHKSQTSLDKLSAGDESLERPGLQRSTRKSFQSGWADHAAT